ARADRGPAEGEARLLEGCVFEARDAVLDHGAGRARRSGYVVEIWCGPARSTRRPSSKTAGEGIGPLNGPPAQMVNRFSHRGAPRGVEVTVTRVKQRTDARLRSDLQAMRRDEWHSTWKTRR